LLIAYLLDSNLEGVPMNKNVPCLSAVMFTFCLFVTLSALAHDSVIVQGEGLNVGISLGMAKKDIIATVGVPSRIKSDGYCLHYDAFDMSLFLDRNLRVERIYVGKDFKGTVGGNSNYSITMYDVYSAQGDPQLTKRLTYTPSPSLQTSASVENEDKLPGTSVRKATFPMEYRGEKTLYELSSHGMIMKYKYVLDDRGIAFWMDDHKMVYATVIYPSEQWVDFRQSLEPIHFDFDKYNIKREYAGILDRDANLIKTHGDVNVTIAGHTDSYGTIEYNQKLSERRAKSVYDSLMERGIPASQMKTVGYGKTLPIADNRTKNGRAMNRRAELEAEGKSKAPLDEHKEE
jgi:outer membrane protein OmpA-like peptidoglycan-associated protein